MKTAESVKRSIKNGKAKVFTASEIKDMVRKGKKLTTDDVDVVTCGTFGVMSGTMAVLSVPVAEPGTFSKADSITLNGVPGVPGPCPNESLGIVDCTVYGTARRDERYGGGHLFRDIVDGNDIDVAVNAGGRTFTKVLSKDNIPFARIIVTRGAFRNYTAFLNPEECSFKTIFSVTGMKGPFKEASVSGCGDINPIQNDPSCRHLREGMPVLLNGSRGMIMGPGTRSSDQRMNLSAFADMKQMDGSMMGGFITSAGPECLTSFAAAIPILDDSDIQAISVLNEDIELPVADIQTRTPRQKDSYGSIWNGTSRRITTDKTKCVNCKHCNAESKCPVSAISRNDIDGVRCMVCGACLTTCVGKVFSADLGDLSFNGIDVPITLRQSDRNRAEALSASLKKRIECGDWMIGGA